MALPDHNRALRRYAEVPVLDATTGAATGKVQFFKHGTNATAAEVLAAGHFNFARSRLAVGDRIEAVCDHDGTAAAINVTVTAVPATSNVTVAEDGATALA